MPNCSANVYTSNKILASFPGSPLAPTKNIHWVRGEPGNKANKIPYNFISKSNMACLTDTFQNDQGHFQYIASLLFTASCVFIFQVANPKDYIFLDWCWWKFGNLDLNPDSGIDMFLKLILVPLNNNVIVIKWNALPSFSALHDLQVQFQLRPPSMNGLVDPYGLIMFAALEMKPICWTVPTEELASFVHTVVITTTVLEFGV